MYPPLRPGQVAGPGREAPPETHVLVDYENVQPTEAQLRALIPAATHVWLFHGQHQKAERLNFAGFGDHLTLVPITHTGKNALDFHLSFYMGYIASRHPEAHFVVLSNDKGYGPMLAHASALGFDAQAVGMPRGKAAAKVAAKTPRGRGASSSGRTRAQPAGAAADAAVRSTAPAPRTSASPAAAPAKATRRTRGQTNDTDLSPAVATNEVSASPAAPAAPEKRSRRKAASPAASTTAATSAPAVAAPVTAQREVEAPAKPARSRGRASPSKADAAATPTTAASATKAPARTPKPAAKAVAQPATKRRGEPSPKAAAKAASADEPSAAAQRKLLATLRRMGDSLPTKLAPLQRYVASTLGEQSTPAQVDALLLALARAGHLSVSANGKVEYALS
nr:PIN domain-containing protein [Ideonella paludis]